MGVDPISLAIGAVGAAGSVGSMVNSNRARGDQRAAAGKQRKLAALENFRERKDQIREARIKRGAQIAAVATGGTLHGSATAAQVTSIASQLQGNLKYIQEAEKLGFSIQASQLSANQNFSAANRDAAFSQLAFTALDLYRGGYFEPTPPPTDTTTTAGEGG